MTRLLLAWNKTLSTHALPERMMPWDVSTHWNSTYDMLKFAIKYRITIDAMTAVHDFDLHQYELLPTEWDIAAKL